MPRSAMFTASTLAAAFLASACSDSTTTPQAGRAVSVSFTSSPSAAAASATLGTSSPSSRSISVASGTDLLVIDRVQLVVARMELERAGAVCVDTAAAGDDASDDHECAQLQLAPSVIDLPVDGGVVGAIAVTVPAGSYSALEARIRPLRADGDHGAASTAFLAAHPDLAGVSVVVTGTFNGTAFTYRGATRAEFETRFSPPLAVDSLPVNLTVHTDVTTWFKTQSGRVIDPSTANASGANAGIVSDNIRRSFKAFRDDDRNGRDDGDDHGRS